MAVISAGVYLIPVFFSSLVSFCDRFMHLFHSQRVKNPNSYITSFCGVCVCMSLCFCVQFFYCCRCCCVHVKFFCWRWKTTQFIIRLWLVSPLFSTATALYCCSIYNSNSATTSMAKTTKDNCDWPKWDTVLNPVGLYRLLFLWLIVRSLVGSVCLPNIFLFYQLVWSWCRWNDNQHCRRCHIRITACVFFIISDSL